MKFYVGDALSNLQIVYKSLLCFTLDIIFFFYNANIIEEITKSIEIEV